MHKTAESVQCVCVYVYVRACESMNALIPGCCGIVK